MVFMESLPMIRDTVGKLSAFVNPSAFYRKDNANDALPTEKKMGVRLPTVTEMSLTRTLRHLRWLPLTTHSTSAYSILNPR